VAFCTNCGTAVEGRFCAQCGSPVSSDTPSNPQERPAPPPAYGAIPSGTQAGLEENLASALCYVLGLLTGVLFLVLEPYNRNRAIRFHAFQSIFLHIAAIAVYLGLMMVIGMLHFIPFVGTFLGLILYPVASFGFFIVWLLLMYKTYNRERWVLPIIGELAEKQA